MSFQMTNLEAHALSDSCYASDSSCEERTPNCSSFDKVEEAQEPVPQMIYEVQGMQGSGSGSDGPLDLPCIASDDELDAAIGNGLGDVQFMQHVPRVNDSELSSSYTNLTESRVRLLERLDLYALRERLVKGDGNCQFRALSDQLYRTPHLHARLREVLVTHLRGHPEWYKEYVPDDYTVYCRKMAASGTWGDHVTLQAVSDRFGVRINVLTSFQHDGSCFIEISPRGELKSQRVLYLSFWAEVHYNSIYPERDPPAKLPEGKFFGSRKLYHFFHFQPMLQMVA